MPAIDTLCTAFINATDRDGTTAPFTLPSILAHLAAGEIINFPALRPHQRHAWHSFLVLLAANALHHAGLVTPPDSEGAWCGLLRALTPEHEDDAPWCLISPPDRPALLQPPIPDGLAGLKNHLATPDELDMLVTSKNHDVKQAVMANAAPEDWLFALLTLQTMEGFLGAGNYGISRMNGGFANRAACSVAPAGGVATQFRRDLSHLRALRERTPAFYAPTDGIALTWLLPWDGTVPLGQVRLDPWYIDICRRVRLIETNGTITARAGSSKAPRIAPIPGGVTGDPWSPVVADKDVRKSLTVDARGFPYARVVELMMTGPEEQAPLQIVDRDDDASGLQLLLRALVRGQGKTEGYHERRVPLPPKVRNALARRTTDPDPLAVMAVMARNRVGDVAELSSRVLKPALLALFQNGPDEIDFREKDSNAKAQIFLKRLEAEVDARFFPDLWEECEADTAAAQNAIRAAWIKRLKDVAEALLREAEFSAAHASRRRWRAGARATSTFHGGFARNIRLSAHFPKTEATA